MKAKPQTSSHYAANALLILAMTFLLTFASTHLMIGELLVAHKKVKVASAGAQKLICLVEKENDNLTMFSVHTGLFFLWMTT